MRLPVRALPLLLFCLSFFCVSVGSGLSQSALPTPPSGASASLLEKFFSRFDLPASNEEAGLRLRHAPNDVLALFIRMETAELQERPEVVLDSALRLCNLGSAAELHELASNRVLQHAGNTWA